jgi:hypothetical protein
MRDPLPKVRRRFGWDDNDDILFLGERNQEFPYIVGLEVGIQFLRH